jgi:hypothetical protein
VKVWYLKDLNELPSNAIARTLGFVSELEAATKIEELEERNKEYAEGNLAQSKVVMEQLERIKELEQKLKWAEYNRDHAIANEREMRKRLEGKANDANHNKNY